MKKNLTTLVLCAFAFGLGISFNNMAFSNIDASKVAYIDVNKLVSASKVIRQAQVNKDKQTAEMLKWYETANADIQKQQTNEGKQTLIKKYEAQLVQKKKAIRDAYAKEINKADTQMDSIITKKAQELGYTLVFKREALIVGGTDITSQILPLVK